MQLTKIIKNYKEDKIREIEEVRIKKLERLFQEPQFEKDKIIQASSAAHNLSLWIKAVFDTHNALLIVEPKRKKLGEAEITLTVANEELVKKQAALQEVVSYVEKL
jgi:dynein heavy chain